MLLCKKEGIREFREDIKRWRSIKTKHQQLVSMFLYSAPAEDYSLGLDLWDLWWPTRDPAGVMSGRRAK